MPDFDLIWSPESRYLPLDKILYYRSRKIINRDDRRSYSTAVFLAAVVVAVLLLTDQATIVQSTYQFQLLAYLFFDSLSVVEEWLPSFLV